MTTSERLQQWRELADNATPGPWYRSGRTRMWIDAGQYDEVIAAADVDCAGHCYGGSSRLEASDADLDFIAAAREAVPALLDEREGLIDLGNLLTKSNGELVAERDRLADEVQRLRQAVDRVRELAQDGIRIVKLGGGAPFAWAIDRDALLRALEGDDQ